MQEVAQQNLQKAHYAASEIAKIDGFELKFSAPFFNEFVVRTPRPAAEVLKRLARQKDNRRDRSRTVLSRDERLGAGVRDRDDEERSDR